METKASFPLAIIVGIQTPGGGNVAHEANLEELGRLFAALI
jgi:hypothetical protein